jgi:ribosome-binding ATPase
MKLGIIGLPGSGKSTVFEALTQNALEGGRKDESRIGTVHVPDTRVEVLSEMHHPQKTIFAQVEYFLPGFMGAGQDKGKDQNIWVQARDCDALIHVVRSFRSYGLADPTPFDDFREIDQELILADLLVVEKRIERIQAEQKRRREVNPNEIALLEECRSHLEREMPLRRYPEIASSPLLRGFAFLSAKPMLVLFNNNDEDDDIPPGGNLTAIEESMVIRGKLEQELTQMPEEEATEFLEEFNISSSAMDRVIKRSYHLLGLISFFTVGEDEVRAWTIHENTLAPNAADVIHSDIKKGFIRAEVVSYDDLMASGSHAAARKQGTVRLEGKTYEVEDGDIINFRFNV